MVMTPPPNSPMIINPKQIIKSNRGSVANSLEGISAIGERNSMILGSFLLGNNYFNRQQPKQASGNHMQAPFSRVSRIMLSPLRLSNNNNTNI